jgi:hypothetical protein
MHVKYKLRKAEGLVTPKGPNFTRAQTIRCDFDGTILSFKVPKHSPYYKRVKEYRPERHYQLETISRFFRCCYGDDNHETPNHLEYYHLFRRFWTFNGPWFTGALAELEMYITLIMPVNFDHEFSLFHPRAFEKLVGDYLTYLYGDHVNADGSHHYTTPVNWQPLTQLPVVAARLEVTPNRGTPTIHTKNHMFFALTDQIMACVRFDPIRIQNISKAELDKRVSEKTMIELMNSIIDSFQLTLSDEAKQQQETALAELEDTSLIKNYPPLDWASLTADQNNKLKKLKD